jgi:hypothetical protein
VAVGAGALGEMAPAPSKPIAHQVVRPAAEVRRIA